MRRAALIAAFAMLAIAPAAARAATVCHPRGRILTRHDGGVLWSARHQRRTLVYLCTPRGRVYVVASGGKYLFPAAESLELAGHFAAFFYYTHFAAYPQLIVFDLKRRRREFTTVQPPSSYRDVFGEDYGFQFFLAPNGWLAGALELGSSPADPFLQEDSLLMATEDGVNYYTIDMEELSPPKLVGDTLQWKTEWGGDSSVALGPDVIPSGSRQQSLSACQIVTAADVAGLLGQASTSSSSGQCTYSSDFTPGMALEVSLQTDLSTAQVSSDEAALRGSGWDGLLSRYGGFLEYENGTPIDYENGTGGATQLDGFFDGAEVSLDLQSPHYIDGGELAGLADIAFERLFAVPVQRAQ